MDNRVKQYLSDIEKSIDDVQTYMSTVNSFAGFEENQMVRRAVEREIEIIGEAMNRILKIDSNIKIPNARSIVNIRNKIIHAYDEVDNVVIYTVARKHLAILKRDIEKL